MNGVEILKTLAAVLVKTREPLQLMELDIPELKPGQVLVKIEYSGICRSQINEIDGIRGSDPYLPHTLGHEGSGIVLKIGSGVHKVKPSDHVVLTWIKGNGEDIPSTIYQSDKGVINSGAISTFTKYAVISENRLIKIPNVMPLREAALFGCALPTGMGIIYNNCKIRPRESIGIIGVGGIGMSSILASRLAGAFPIIAVDIDDIKLQIAQKNGATHIINSAQDNAFTEIMSISQKKGLDYVVEAVGQQKTMELAYSVTRMGGGNCIIAGNPPEGTQIHINPYDLINGKNLCGTWGGETEPDRDIPRLISQYLEKKFSLNSFIGAEYSLSQVNEAINDFRLSNNIRILIRMS